VVGYDSGPATYDVRWNRDGCLATLDIEGISGTTDVIRIGDELWTRPAEAYWLAADGGQATADAYAGRWVHGSVGHPGLRGDDDSCVLPEWVGLSEDEGSEYTYRMGEATTVDGQPAVTVLIEETHPQGTVNTSLVIAGEGEAYPLRATVETDSESGGQMTITCEWDGYDQPTEITPPPDGEVVAIGDLAPEDNPFPLGG
jgi:hypothetical protein